MTGYNLHGASRDAKTRLRGKGRGAPPSEDQLARLLALGFSWEYEELFWPKFVRHLEDFVADYGHAAPQYKDVSPGGYRLGRAVDQARQIIRATPSAKGMTPPTEDQLRRLSDMGFTVRLSETFGTRLLRHVREYVAEKGTADIPFACVSPDGYRLGQQIQVAKRVVAGKKTAATLAPGEITELLNLGVCLDVKAAVPNPTVGARFGSWTVTGSAVRHGEGKKRVLAFPVRCECGTESVVPKTTLTRGQSIRCRLHKYERAA